MSRKLKICELHNLSPPPPFETVHRARNAELLGELINKVNMHYLAPQKNKINFDLPTQFLLDIIKIISLKIYTWTGHLPENENWCFVKIGKLNYSVYQRLLPWLTTRNFFITTHRIPENAILVKKYFRAWHTTHTNHHWEIIFSLFIMDLGYQIEINRHTDFS